MKRTLETMLAVALAAVALPALAGDVEGKITYNGAPPKLSPMKTNRDQKVCGNEIPDESVEVKGKALENVVVTIEGPGIQKPAPVTVKLDQLGCRYRPHVLAAPAGSTLDIINSDPLLHNIHGYLGQQTLFNVAMPIKGQQIPKPLPRKGLVHVKCDVHSWMNGWIVVTDGLYAVVGEDGSYAIKGVPAGSYTVQAWHEKLGNKTQAVTVPASGPVTANFDFTGG